MKIKELPELERPYEKLELYGEKTLSNAELLAIIIKTGTKQETSVQIAQKLLKQNDTMQEDLSYLQTLTIEELMSIKGIGKVKAIQLKAVGELAVRMFKKTNYKKTVIKTPNDVAKLLMSEMKFKKTEVIKVVILNARERNTKNRRSSIRRIKLCKCINKRNTIRTNKNESTKDNISAQPSKRKPKTKHARYSIYTKRM